MRYASHSSNGYIDIVHTAQVQPRAHVPYNFWESASESDVIYRKGACPGEMLC